MPRQSKSPLKVRENESACPEEKEEASFPQSKDQKICKVTKPKASRASRKENLSAGSQARSWKRALKYPGEELSQPEGHPRDWQCPGGWFGALQGHVGSEPTLPLSRKANVSGSRSGSLGSDFCSTPEGGRAEGKPDFGISEEQREEPVDFAAGTMADLGIAPGSFTDPCTGSSPALLKFRRRSTIGLRGSPENNTLIRFLAQHRSHRHQAALTEVSPFKDANVRPLKDRIEGFQTFLESLQEAEEEPGLSGLSHVGDAPQEGGSAQNKVPFKEEPNLKQWREKLVLDSSGAAWRGNVGENVTQGSKSPPRTCSILSPHPGGAQPAAPEEWVSEHKNPAESLETVGTGDVLETGHVSRCGTSRDVPSDPSREKAGFVRELSLGVCEESKALGTPPVTPRRAGSVPVNGLTLTSILKKTPRKQLLESPKEYWSDGGDRGGGDCVPVSWCEKAFGASETENTESLAFKTPKKKKVTFGEVLSPEIFDQSLPANTPLRRGASPGLSCSPAAHPLPRLHFAWEEECVEPLQEFLEGPVGAADPAAGEGAADPAAGEDAEAAPTDTPDRVETRSSARRKHRAQEPGGGSSSGATDTGNAADTTNPGKSKIQGQRDPPTSAPRKTQRTRHTGCGKRRKRKPRKSLYGPREMASRKPLLSPIPEIPELLSAGSSPGSPKARPSLTEGAAVDHPKSRDACRDVEGMRGKNSSAICFPGADSLGIAGIPPAVSSYSIEEAFSVPGGSLQRSGRRSSTGGETRVRRSMRLSKDVAAEGLAWIQLSGEAPGQPPLPHSAPKSRRKSTSILTGAENIPPREQSPVLFSALGKENEDSAAGPCRRRRRRSAATPQEPPGAQTKRRRLSNSVNKDIRNSQKHPEEAEIPLEVPGGVSAIAEFLK